MKINGDSAVFERSDMKFVEKFGIVQATGMVLDYRSVYPLPFIHDTDQLAAFLNMGKKTLFDLTRNINRSYSRISIPKKSGGRRILHIPDDALKSRQRKILREILDLLPVSEHATAYRRGGRLQQNASPHCGRRYLLKMDITDFFGSIPFHLVYGSAFNTGYFPKQIGVMLTTICCRNDVLPQGAPTSPALSNIVMKRFDDAMGGWCSKRDISYTRYCDDLTFSSDKPLFIAYRKAKDMLESMGFELNDKKTRFITSASRQCVTGLTVNEKVSVPADYKRRLRQEIHYVRKYGAKNALEHIGSSTYISGGVTDTERYLSHLIGQAEYVHQIEPDNNWFFDALYDLYIQITHI